MIEKNNMEQKSLIIFSSILFACSAFFLFWQNDRALDPARGPGFWTISFTSPQDPTDLSFTLENQSTETSFRYQITANKELLGEDTIVVQKGEQTTVTVPSKAQVATRTEITVSGEQKEDTKKIYR